MDHFLVFLFSLESFFGPLLGTFQTEVSLGGKLQNSFLPNLRPDDFFFVFPEPQKTAEKTPPFFFVTKHDFSFFSCLNFFANHEKSRDLTVQEHLLLYEIVFFSQNFIIIGLFYNGTIIFFEIYEESQSKNFA